MKLPAQGGRLALLGSLRREFVGIGLFSGMANLLLLTPTLYMMQVYDRVLTGRSELTLLALSLVALMFLAMLGCSEWMRNGVLVRAGLALDRELARGVFAASFATRLDQAPAEGAGRASGDLLQVRQFLTGPGVFGFFDLPWTPVYVVVCWIMHPVLGALALLFVALHLALAWIGHRRTLAAADGAARATTRSQLFVMARLRHAETVEAMGMLDAMRARWQAQQSTALAQHTQAQRLAQRVGSASRFLRYAQQSLTLATGALLVIRGELTPGSMIAANLLVARALAPVDVAVANWRPFSAAAAAYLRLRALLEASLPMAAGGEIARPTGALRVRGLVASVPDRSEPILQPLDLDIAAGETLAVLGPSGSGKSTLARCLLGIWPQAQGEVMLDGVPVCRADRAALGPHLGYLPQDLELFDGTVAENIARLGDADARKVIAAARATGLHEAILRLPKGYDTAIGEAGALLSAGQRQRLALARALYGEPALLVLDEPDSHLDEAGEAALAAALQEQRRRGCTVVVVTHRRALLELADRALLLAQGRVVALGAPAAVVAAWPRAQPTRISGAEPQPA